MSNWFGRLIDRMFGAGSISKPDPYMSEEYLNPLRKRDGVLPAQFDFPLDRPRSGTKDDEPQAAREKRQAPANTTSPSNNPVDPFHPVNQSLGIGPFWSLGDVDTRPDRGGHPWRQEHDAAASGGGKGHGGGHHDIGDRGGVSDGGGGNVSDGGGGSEISADPALDHIRHWAPRL